MIVASGFGLPQAPFVTRALGKAIQQAFPTGRSGVNRLELYRLQEEALKKYEPKVEVEKPAALVVKKVAKKVIKPRVQRVIEEPELVFDPTAMDNKLSMLSQRVAQLETYVVDYFVSFSIQCYNGIIAALPLKSKDDEETALLLCL